jgi:hypothetical protein
MKSIETRLRRLEEQIVPETPPRRVHIVASPTPEEGDANIDALVAAGEADPGDLFCHLVPGEPDPDSAMFESHRWEGCWVPKDGRDDAAIARLRANGGGHQ